MEITVKVEGLKDLEKALLKLADEYGPKHAVSSMRPAMKAAAQPLEDSIRATTPIDSGRLAETTRTRIGKPTGKMLQSEHFHKDMVIVARIGWTWGGGKSFWNQSLAQEFGTSEQSGSAPLWTTMQSHAGQAVKDFGDVLGPAIEKKAASLNKKRNK